MHILPGDASTVVHHGHSHQPGPAGQHYHQQQQQQQPSAKPAVGRQAFLARLYERRNALLRQHEAVVRSSRGGQAKLHQVDAAILQVDREIARWEDCPPSRLDSSAPRREVPAQHPPAVDVAERLLAACEAVLQDQPGLQPLLAFIRAILPFFVASSAPARCL